MQNKRQVSIVLSLILFILGFMLAIQFQTNKNPKVKDTRNINELRITLQKERERAQLLTNEIAKYDQLLYQYETSAHKDDGVTDIMEKELNRIKKLAGFEEVTGAGFTIELKELTDEEYVDHYFSPLIYDHDLRLIINELFAYGAKAVSINGERIIANTAIRNVGDRILVNTIPITPPYTIKVIGDSDILIPALRLAGIDEYFKVVNHTVIFQQRELLKVPKYRHNLNVRYLELYKEANK